MAARSASTIDRCLISANGQNLLRITDVVSTARSICVPLIDVPNGAYTDKMIDTSFFAPYGVSVRDVNSTTVATVYVPLNLVTDPATNDRVAFAARMPYWPSDPTNWGNSHQVPHGVGGQRAHHRWQH